VFLDPVLTRWHFTTIAATVASEQKVDAKEVQQQLDNLRKVANENKNTEVEKSKEMKELLEEWEKLVNKPVDATNAEQVREHVAEMRNLEQKLKERAHELKANAQKNDGLKRLLDKLNEDDRRLREGPAKDFEDAIMKGNFNKAKDALDKLAKQLQNRQLTPQQQKDLAEQFKQLQEKIQRVMEKDEKLKQLKKDFDEGRINKEQLDREMKKMGAKDLQELANLLGQCKECLGQDAGEAAAELAKMAKQFEQADLTEQELDEILRNMEALNEAALGLGDALGDGDENGLGGGGPPGGRRPIDPNDPDSKIVNQRQKGQVNPNSQQRITGFTSGGNFSKIPAKQVEGSFKTAAQNAPQAIERQNIPEDAAGIARGYFQKLGGQK
jgi:DNA repair exonuclease SbcCD ATPase subunit